MATDPGDHGTFPFGRPNTTRPLCKPESGNADALIVGVYPSAFHVAWTPPPSLDPRPAGKRRRPLISSLAVDVESTVFWDGSHPDPNELLDTWKVAVGFDPDRHGTVAVGTNGPSGQQLPATVLNPLGLDPTRVAYTDVAPWYFVKTTKGSQGAAIAERFNPLAGTVDAVPGALPARPTKRQLVELAASERRVPSLRSEVREVGAPLVITLGQEAIDALRAVADTLEGAQRQLEPRATAAREPARSTSTPSPFVPLPTPGSSARPNTLHGALRSTLGLKMSEFRVNQLGDVFATSDGNPIDPDQWGWVRKGGIKDHAELRRPIESLEDLPDSESKFCRVP